MLIPMLAVAAAALTPGGAAPDDPLAPARAGKIECYSPDLARKTCKTLARYSFAGDGGISSHSEALLSVTPWINMAFDAPVSVRDGEVCGPFAGIDRAEVFVDGKPADVEMTNKVRERMQKAYASFGGLERCAVYEADGDGYVVTVVARGKKHPKTPQRVIWVDPADGWTVKP